MRYSNCQQSDDFMILWFQLKIFIFCFDFKFMAMEMEGLEYTWIFSINKFTTEFLSGDECSQLSSLQSVTDRISNRRIRRHHLFISMFVHFSLSLSLSLSSSSPFPTVRQVSKSIHFIPSFQYISQMSCNTVVVSKSVCLFFSWIKKKDRRHNEMDTKY